METVFQEAFELKLKPQVVSHHEYMPRVYEVNLPCQWLEHCQDGKCPALTKINGNFYCAKKNSH
jgi:hypothetical protein